MALIETNFIRPQEVYDRNTGESKVRYRSYDGNDRFIPVVNGEKGVPKTMVEVTHAELKAMRDGGKLTAGALYRITDYNCTTTQVATQSAGHQFDIVLLALSENKLAEEGWAMMHDNIYDVTFDDGVTKKCYLYRHIVDDALYINVVSIDNLLGWMIVENSGEITINEEDKTAITTYETGDLETEGLTYNYFQNSNLSAWKVWYCLDNDTARFAWADGGTVIPDTLVVTQDGEEVSYIRGSGTKTVDGTTYYKWKLPVGLAVSTYLTEQEFPTESDVFYRYNQAAIALPLTAIGTVSSFIPEHVEEGNGRGVIYRLIDEFNNDIKYDFKNIQFMRTITDGQYDEEADNTWCYTLNVWYDDMCQDASIVGNTILNDEGYISGVYDNNFGYATAYDLGIVGIGGVDTFAFALGNNVVLSLNEGGAYYGINSNTIGNAFYSNTIGDVSYSNIIGNGFSSNIIGNGFRGNIIGHDFSSNTIGSGVCFNMIGNDFSSKTISDNTSYKNYGNNGVELATKS